MWYYDTYIRLMRSFTRLSVGNVAANEELRELVHEDEMFAYECEDRIMWEDEGTWEYYGQDT